jgi:hypothetical protein
VFFRKDGMICSYADGNELIERKNDTVLRRKIVKKEELLE